jgi:L-ascorbate metabolism protein UlaG (beta-lactamase superfamily)
MNPANELSLSGTDVTATDRAQGSILFVGTATVILRYAGFTILTDPNFLHRGDHVHLGHGMTATRRTDPALELEALPPVDFVVLSHMHEDHFDREVERKLDRYLPIVTTPHAAVDLTSKGFSAAKALNTWETLTVAKGSARVRITSTPGAHGRGFLAKMLPDVMGSLLEFENALGGSAFRIYITGDTLLFDELKEIPRRFPDIDLALLHLGGTMFFGVLMVTMDPRQGVEVIRLSSRRRPSRSITTTTARSSGLLATRTTRRTTLTAGGAGRTSCRSRSSSRWRSMPRQAPTCTSSTGARRTPSRSPRAAVEPIGLWSPSPDRHWQEQPLGSSGDIIPRRGEGDIVNCDQVLGKMGNGLISIAARSRTNRDAASCPCLSRQSLLPRAEPGH